MILDILIILIVFILGFRFSKVLYLKGKDIKRLRILWIYHFLFGILYYFYVLSEGGSDSLKYWSGATLLTGHQALLSLVNDFGTQAMYAINYIPANVMGLSFFTGTILYCFIGFMGLVFFYKIATDLVPNNYRIKKILLFPTIFYLPNLHFWSVAVGKDALLFFCVGLFAYSMLSLNKRIILVVISSLLAFIVRPHIVLFLVLAFSMAFLMNKRINTFKRVFFFAILAGIGIAMLPSVMDYTNIENASVDSYEQFAQNQAGNLSRAHTTSSVDISSYPFPLKVFTFLYRPTFTDINGIPALLAAVENLILLILSIMVLKHKPVKTFKKAPFTIKGLVFFLIIGTVAFSVSLGNLGIMLRMRNMFLPGMLIFICYSFSCYKERKAKVQQIFVEKRINRLTTAI